MNGCRVVAAPSLITPRRRRPGAVVEDLDRGDDLHFALRTAPAAAGGRIILGPEGDQGLVDLDHAGKQGAGGVDHGPAQLGAQQPSALVGAQPQLPPPSAGPRCRWSGWPSGRPPRTTPSAAASSRASPFLCRDRGLPVAPGAFPCPRLGVELPGVVVAAGRAANPSGQRAAASHAAQAASSGNCRWNSSTERGNSGMAKASGNQMFMLCSIICPTRCHHISSPRRVGDKQ